MVSPQVLRDKSANKFNANNTARLINFKYSVQHEAAKSLFNRDGSVSTSNYYDNSRRSDVGSKSSIRDRHNMSQQYQKFKISLARGNKKKQTSPISNLSKIKKNFSQHFDEEGSQMTVNEMTEQIKFFEAKIKETKKNLLHEREMNIMLRDENENLRKTNQIIDKGILQSTQIINSTISDGGEFEDIQK